MVDRRPWARLAIEGGMRIIDISRLPGAPSYHTLRQWSCQDNWRGQREEWLKQDQGQGEPVVEAEVDPPTKRMPVQSPEDEVGEDLESRHRKIFRYMQTLALKKLSSISPEQLSVKEAIQLLEMGLKGEQELPKPWTASEWTEEDVHLVAHRIYGVPIGMLSRIAPKGAEDGS